LFSKYTTHDSCLFDISKLPFFEVEIKRSYQQKKCKLNKLTEETPEFISIASEINSRLTNQMLNSDCLGVD
jgi:hypothetical protein